MGLDDLIKQSQESTHDVVEDNVVEQLRDGQMVRYVITNVRPTKDEVVALGEIPRDTDVSDSVPWKQGIYLDYMISHLVDEVDGQLVERPLYTIDAIGNVKFTFQKPHFYTGVDSIKASSIEKIRFYNERHNAIKLQLPANFDTMTPQERFSFLFGAISRKHGQKMLPPGSSLYGYISKRLVGEQRDADGSVLVKGKWFTSIERSHQNKATKQWSDMAPWTVGTVPEAEYKAVVAALRAEYETKDGDLPF